jgi:hypothetical protein
MWPFRTDMHMSVTYWQHCNAISLNYQLYAEQTSDSSAELSDSPRMHTFVSHMFSDHLHAFHCEGYNNANDCSVNRISWVTDELRIFDLKWNRKARILLLVAPRLCQFLHPTPFMLMCGIYLYLLIFFTQLRLRIVFYSLVRSTWSQVAQSTSLIWFLILHRFERSTFSWLSAVVARPNIT